VNFSP